MTDPEDHETIGVSAAGSTTGVGGSSLPHDEHAPTILATSEPAPVRPFQADTVLEKYRILGLLGQGGMGQVYEAEQVEPIRRRVAIKVIKRGMDTEQIVARFESERQALALMDHECIAKVFDGGATPDGRPYFVMELVRGIPLTDYCQQNKLGLRQRLELFLPICEGVQHAHQKGVIHRDLKPSNVMVTVADNRPVPKIIDFGLAKATGGALTDRALHTEVGQLMGTPEYMSPEQAGQSGLDVDTRADVYSLGVILYELLVGDLPFDSKALRQGSYEDIRRRIREDEPLRPSRRATTLMGASDAGGRTSLIDPAVLSKLLHGDLDWIVMKAIEKDRTRRYPSASDLAADIVRHLKDEPVLASPPSRVYLITKFVKRHRAAVAAATAIALATVLGMIGTTVGLVRARSAERQARQEAETARQMSDFMVGLFKVADPESSLGNRITAREILDRGARRIETELSEQPLLRARMLGTIGEVYRSLGLYSSSRPLLESALALQRGPALDRMGAARTESSLGELERLSGNLAQAESLFSKALASQLRLRGPDHPEVAAAMCDLGALLAARSRYDEADSLLTRSLAIREQQLTPGHPDIGRSANELGVLRWRQEKFVEAESLLTRAVAVWKKAYGENHPSVARALTNLAIVYRAQGRGYLAIPLYQRVLTIYESTYGPEHPRVAVALNNLGRVLFGRGDYGAAAPLYVRALAIQEKTLGPDHPNLATALNNLANLRSAERNYAEAQALFRRALAIRERALGPDHPDVGWSLGDLGVLLRDRGEYGRAETQFQRALGIFERAGQGQGVAWTLKDLALTARGRGDLPGAERYFRRAVTAFEAAMGADHPDLAQCLEEYAGVIRQLGRAAEAEPVERRAREIRAALAKRSAAAG